MNITHSHSLELEEAKARLAVLGNYFTNKYGLDVSWNDDGTEGTIKGKYMVVAIDATLNVTDDAVTCVGKDPGFLWRKKAVKYIEGKLSTYLDPATAVDDLPDGSS